MKDHRLIQIRWKGPTEDTTMTEFVKVIVRRWSDDKGHSGEVQECGLSEGSRESFEHRQHIFFTDSLFYHSRAPKYLSSSILQILIRHQVFSCASGDLLSARFTQLNVVKLCQAQIFNMHFVFGSQIEYVHKKTGKRILENRTLRRVGGLSYNPRQVLLSPASQYSAVFYSNKACPP